MTTDLKQKNYELFYGTISSLASSQGFYGRLKNQIDSIDDDERARLVNDLPTFKDTIDVVLWLEQ